MAESIGTARLDIVVDTSSLDAGVSKAKRGTQEMAKASQDASQKMDAGTKRQVQALERQIATLGKSRAEVIKWRIEQQTSGRVAQELSARLDAQTAKLAASSKRMDAIGASAKRAAIGLAAVGATVAGAALTAGVRNAIEFADKLNDLNVRLGVSAEALSGWAFAAKQTGTDIDQLGTGMLRLSRNLADASNSSSEQGKLFVALGVSAKDAQGNLRDLEDVLPAIADKFKGIENETLKAALAQKLFGRSGAELIEFLNQGAVGLEAMRSRARELGLELSQGTLSAADSFNDKLAELKSATQGLFTQIAAGLLPAMTETTEKFTALASNGDLARNAVTVFSGALRAGVGTLQVYNLAVDTLSARIEQLVGVMAGLAQAQANFSTLGFADGSLVGGLKGAARSFAAGETGVASAFNRFNAPAQGVEVVRSTSTAGTGQFANVNRSPAEGRAAEFEKRLNALLGGGGSARGGAGRLSKVTDLAKGAQAELQRLADAEGKATEAFRDMEAQLQGPLAVAVRDHEKRVAELNELAKQSPEASARLSAALELEAKRHREATAAIEAQLNPLGLLLEDMKFELDLIGRSNAERVVMNELRQQGIDLLSAEAQATIAAARGYEVEAAAKGRSIELMDEWRAGTSDALAKIVTDFDNAGRHVTDFFDRIAERISQMIAEGWVEQLFGQMGTSQTGSAGGFLGGFADLIFGGGWGGIAKGAAFHGGQKIDTYAMGGVFDRATLFAHGGRLGVMGEAGPEAIMPLSRGPDGKLGVRAEGGRRETYAPVMNQTFVVQGTPDKRTREQMASQSGRAAQRAMSRTR